jgi:hypothetical protein
LPFLPLVTVKIVLFPVVRPKSIAALSGLAESNSTTLAMTCSPLVVVVLIASVSPAIRGKATAFVVFVFPGVVLVAVVIR